MYTDFVNLCGHQTTSSIANCIGNQIEPKPVSEFLMLAQLKVNELMLWN